MRVVKEDLLLTAIRHSRLVHEGKYTTDLAILEEALANGIALANWENDYERERVNTVCAAVCTGAVYV